jgi:hypothetical protein
MVHQRGSIFDFLLQRPEIAHLRTRQDGVHLPVESINHKSDCSVATSSFDVVTLSRTILSNHRSRILPRNLQPLAGFCV